MAAIEWITVEEWAGRHRITRQAAYKRVREHQIPLRNGKLNAEEADRIWFASFNPNKQNGGIAGGRAAAEARADQPALFDASGNTIATEQMPEAPEGMQGRLPQTALGRVQLMRDMHRANYEKLRFEMAQGKLVSLGDVIRFQTEVYTRLRDELSSIGAEIMDALHAATDAVECREIVDRRVEKALRSLSDWRPSNR